MKELKDVTLIIADCSTVPQAIHSIKRSLSIVQPERVILFTSIDIPSTDEYEVIKIEHLKSKEDYSRWIMRELYKHITTAYVWVAQWDSWALDASAWTDEFLSVDYIGSSWLETDGFAVGNGGGSVRSRRLMEAVATDPIIVSTHPEDNQICKVYRPYLEARYGFKWASVELADKWGFELKSPSQSTFTFHSFFHKPYQKTIVIRRRDAMGDVIQVEPVMHYFHQKGYKVVLETLPQFYGLFFSHYFKVHQPQEIDGRELANAQVITLDLGYETNPKRLHLQSYYDMAGINDGVIRNPKLTMPYDPKERMSKIFKRYCVIHNDIRGQEGRNIYGVDWNKVAHYLKEMGYDIIQIGNGAHETPTGAIEIINLNLPLLMRLIGGADLFIGIDSGPFNIALAMDTPAVVFFGSVNPEYIIPNTGNVHIIQKHNRHNPICRNVHCWHSKVGTEGVECIEISGKVVHKFQSMQGEDKCIEPNPIPPCVDFDTEMVLKAINKMTNEKSIQA